MKSLFSKLSVLLLAAGFAVVGCQDFAEDIRQVEEKLDQNTGELTLSTDNLEKEIDALEAQQKADKEAADKALASLKATLQGEIDADVQAASNALTAAFATAEAALRADFAAADAQQKEDLVKQINDAKAAATAAITNLEAAYIKADNDIKAAYAAEDVKLNNSILALQGQLEAKVAELNGKLTTLETKIAAVESACEKANEATKAELNAKLDKLESDYKAADAQQKEDLLKEINKVQAALTEADERLTKAVGDLATELATAKAALEADIDAVEAALKAADEDLQKQITENAELIADLQEADINLQAAIDKNADDIKDEAKARAEALEALTNKHIADSAKLQGQIDVNKDAIAAEKKAREALEAEFDQHVIDAAKALADAKAELEKKDAELQAAIDKNAADIVDLQGEVVKLQGRADALEAWQAEAKLALANHEGRIAQNEADIKLLEAADVALQKNIDAAIEKAENELAAFEQLVADTYATKKELNDGLNNLEIKLTDAINAVDDKVGVLTKKVNDYITATNKTLAELIQADIDINNLIATTKTELEEAIKDGDDAVLAALATAKEELNNALADAKDELEGLIEDEEEARKAAITALETALNTKIDGVQTQVTANATALAALETRVKTAEDNITSLATRLGVVEGQVNDLLARIQKMVYLPDYSDGKVTIEYAKIGTTVIESRSELKYKVYPAAAAKDVADAAEYLKFDVVGVKTRAGNPALNIVSAVADDKGVITFTVEPRDLADAFYAGTESYSAALVLENGNDSYSTEYANLLATTTPETITVDLYNSANTSIAGTTTDNAVTAFQSIAYLNSTDVKEILKGHYIGFKIGAATEVLTETDMNNAGYEVVVPDAVVSYQYWNMFDKTTVDTQILDTDPNYATVQDYFVPTIDPETGVVSVKLAENNPIASVEKAIVPVYTYTMYGTDYFAGSLVQIVKEKREFDLGAHTTNWSYTPDADQDAKKYLGNPYSYDRTIQVSASSIQMQGALLGESYEDVVTTGTLISTTVNGSASTAVTFGYDAVSGNATVTYIGFEWDKTYDIVATYETSATDVEIKFALTTVDRKREPIIVETDPTVSTTEKPLVYKKDMAITQGTYNVPFGDKLFKELEDAGNIAGIDKAAYLTDVFNNSKPYYDILNSYYNNAVDPAAFLKDDGGADTWNTRLVIDGATCEFTFGYSYKSFTEVITNLKYRREFTTWYGQKFVLEHVLTIDLPKYDFAHTSYYVKANADNTGWYSKVMGQYTPSITATDVSAFSVANVDMDMAFNVVDKATATPTIIPAAELATYGLVTEFELESTIPGITITANEISYLSPEAQIGVTGKLYIENTGGLKLYLPTSFADTYANYVVKKYDPIGALTVTENPEVDVVDAKVYNINVLEYYKLMDNRNETPVWDLIVDGAFLNGNGTNGYDGLVTTIYGLSVDYAAVTVPAEYTGIITFDGAGTLSFDNSGQLTLVEDVIIPVTLKINYTWGSREGTINVKFKKNFKE